MIPMKDEYLWIASIVIFVILLIVIMWLKKRPKRIQQYWKNGNIRSSYFINKSDSKEGSHTFYYKNGKINKESN